MSRRKAASGSKKRNCKGPRSRGVGERKTRSLVGLTIIELGGFCAKLSAFLRTESCRQADSQMSRWWSRDSSRSLWTPHPPAFPSARGPPLPCPFPHPGDRGAVISQRYLQGGPAAHREASRFNHLQTPLWSGFCFIGEATGKLRSY